MSLEGMDVFRKGLRPPSLCTQIKSILNQYEDSGQILKELIQNADDANASRVVFLYDQTQHGKSPSNLLHPKLDKYQGPALFAYNDAVFTKDDWENILRLHESKKATDKMKVGRFGLGFKSVFHITDVPEVLSGNGIGAVDPQENLFYDVDERGRQSWMSAMGWDLGDVEKSKLTPFQSELFPDSSLGTTGAYFPGTVFRFPLRCEEHKSLLSDNLYDDRKVRLLLDSLSVESEMSLLFLKNVEKIDIYERKPNGKPQALLTIEITLNSLSSVRKGRQQFLQCTKQNIRSENAEPVKVDYIMSIETVKYEAGAVKERRETSWMVVQYLGGGHELWSAIHDKYPGAKHMPWVSTAVRLGAPPTGSAGHVFCFLPLPLVPENRTGLNMHVSGFFAVDPSRRYLKWPSLDQKEVTDPEMLWNQFLLEKVLPYGMVDVIMSCIQQQIRTSKYDPDLIYSLIPDPENLSLKGSMWQTALPSFFKLLASQAVLFKQAPNPMWLHWSEGIFASPRWSENERKVIGSILLEAGQPYVEPPSHARDSFVNATGKQAKEGTSKLVRSLLHEDKYKNLTERLKKADRLILLQYVLSDAAHQEMPGIYHLLPLADGSFTTFTQSISSHVYIDNLDIMRLLPGTETYFVHAGLPDELTSRLTSLAESGCSQLQMSTVDTFPRILAQIWHHSPELTIPFTTRFNEQWLDQVWEFIRKSYTRLTDFSGLHLVPTGNNRIAMLSKKRPVIERSRLGRILPQAVLGLLEKVKIAVVEQLPGEVYHREIKIYVQGADQGGVARCLSLIYTPQVTSAIENMSRDERIELRNFFARGIDVLEDHVRLVRSLPIFQLLGSDLPSSGDKVVAPLSSWPIPIFADVIAMSDDSTRILVRFLDLSVLTEASFLMEFILPYIKQGKYQKKHVKGIMGDTLEKLTKLSAQESGFCALLKNIPFVETGDSTSLHTPCELFDPSDPVLKAMFEKLNELPHGKIVNSKYCGTLKKIGLKRKSDVGTNDILRVARFIESKHRKGDILVKEAKALITFLTNHPGKLSDRSLVEELSAICWVPVLQQPPFGQHFPPQLPWAGRDRPIARPDQVIAARFAPIVGSVQPLVSVDDAQLATIGKAFHWNSAMLQTVLRHLKNLTECYCNEMRAPTMLIVQRIYEYLINNARTGEILDELQRLELDRFVWVDSRFVTPQQVMLSSPPFSLEPYVYGLPHDMYKFHTLLSGLGVEKTVDLTSVLPYIRDYHHSCPAESDTFKQEADRDLGIVLNILNKIASDRSDNSNLLIPVHTQDGNLRMMDISEVCYCDREWYQKGMDEDDVTEDDEKPIHLIHPKIPLPLAEKLEVPSMTSQLLDSEPMAFGQSESLTRRLHTLLHDYSDGLAVLKELIQNADDAGAKEIRFLYDERENLDARTYLFDKHMADLQGPALLAYNDAEFSEADFESIVKLSAGSKVDQTTKVGRFGLGFNAVYNLTDVPFFVSNGKFVVFDPHRRFLGKALRSNDQPGLKLDINKHRRKIKKLADQFKPFEGIFGCRILDTKESGFKGTLFRFPLRTTDQADMSDINKKHYADRTEVSGLLQLLVNCADSILLFLQNVLKITVWHLPRSATGPDDMALTCTFEKTHERSLRSYDLNFSHFHFLNHVDNEMQRQVSQKPSSKAERNNLVRITSTHNHEGGLGLDLPARQKRDTLWLVSQAMGQGQSFKMWCSDKTLLPVGGVAVPVTSVGTSELEPEPVEHSRLFCFLPLPSAEPIDFPVHVNGYFAVTSDRRHLFEQDRRDKDDVRAQWNQALMVDAVALAFVNLLEDLSTIGNTQKINMLWPEVRNKQPTSSLVESLKYSVYRSICRPGGPSVFPSKASSQAGSQPKCVPFERCVFLDTDLLQSGITDAFFSVFEDIQDSQFVCYSSQGKGPDRVARVSLSVTLSLKAVFGDQMPLKGKLYDMKRFYSKIFLPNVSTVDPTPREELLVFALLHGDQFNDLHSLLKQQNCIPVTPCGRSLESPGRLVHPGGPLSDMFSPEDGRTPYFVGQVQHQALIKLVEIGMAYDDLPWNDVLNRCQSVEKLYKNNVEQGIKRIKAILQLMDKKLKTESKCKESVKTQIQQTGFLPVHPKPKEYLLSWAGDQFENVCLSPQEMYLHDQMHVVGAVYPIVNHVVLNQITFTGVKTFLDLNRKPNLDLVLKQLEIAIEITENANTEGKPCLSVAFSPLYHYLNTECRDRRKKGPSAAKVAQRFGQRRCIYTSDMMCLPQECSKNGPHRPPYLHRLPDMLQHRHEDLLQTLGVREGFDFEDFIKCLFRIHEKNGLNALSVAECRIAIDTAIDLARYLISKKMAIEEAEQKCGEVYVPGQNMVMCLARDLCYNNCPWLEVSDPKYSHKDITWEHASTVGVRTIREVDNEKNSIGLEFGQEEELSSRIQRILTGYPFDKEVFNELLQNADDAGATDIHFVLDLRTHGTERLFEDSWRHLQGPALCVYNNSPFTRDDIKGIQKLGQGNKDLDPTKTGQYGVGFNCVYHLTDTPTILTDVVGEGLSLCAFDPNLLYVPCATKAKPGRLYQVTPYLQQSYSDVFTAYLPELLSVTNATIFRFPLRTKEQAIDSRLSKEEVKPDNVKDMFKKYIENGAKSLLFLNNIKSVKISEISQEGEKFLLHHIWSDSSPEDSSKQVLMSDKLQEAKNQLSSGTISRIQPFETIQRITVRNNEHLSENWLIVKRIGFNPNAGISQKVLTSFERKEMSLLPRGGVAYCTSSRQREKCSWFCLLPLPIETDLPVHFNGHFALDYENRRNVWKHNAKDAKADWNHLLFKEVIAPAYVTMIQKRKEMVTDHKGQVQTYKEIFPPCKSDAEDSYEGALARAVYRNIADNGIPILPAFVPNRQGPSPVLEWFPPTASQIEDQVYFNDLKHALKDKDATRSSISSFPGVQAVSAESKANKRYKAVHSTLQQLGLPMVISMLDVNRAFQAAGVKTLLVSPEVVTTFLRSYGQRTSRCHVGPRLLPANIDETGFSNEYNLRQVLSYCLRPEDSDITGLPLQLRQDKVLTTFTVNNPIFVSRFAELLPKHKELFLHHSLLPKIESYANKKSCKENPVKADSLKTFKLTDFVGLLGQMLPEERFVSDSENIPVHEIETHVVGVKATQWLALLWNFLVDAIQTAVGDKPEKQPTSESYLQILSPVHAWKLLPVYRKDQKPHLVPVSNMSVTIHLPQVDILKRPLEKALGLIGVDQPWFWDLFNIHYASTNTLSILSKMLGSIENPKAILSALKYLQDRNSLNFDGVSDDMRKNVHDYFDKQYNDLGSDRDVRAVLQKLPIYRNRRGQHVALYGRNVYLLSNDIPREGDEHLENSSGSIFLSKGYERSDFHAFLHCQEMINAEFYTKICLQNSNFCHLSEEERLAHLENVRDRLLTREKNSADTLITTLKRLQFLNDSNGTLTTASSFYDKTNPVFACMHHDIPEPPAPYNDNEWKKFLITCGMISELTESMFVEYARKVEKESKYDRSNEVAKKSKLLVKYLLDAFCLRTQAVFTDNLLKDVRNIRFIVPHKVRDGIEGIHPQYGAGSSGSLPFIAFEGSAFEAKEKLLWTVCPLLPSFAISSNYVLHTEQEKVLKNLAICNGQNEILPKVVQNLKKVSRLLGHGQLDKSILRPSFKAVMNSCYEFLHKQEESKGMIVKELSDAPIAAVENWEMLIPAFRICTDIRSEDEIKPFLFNIPKDLAEYDQLFRWLGAQVSPTSQQYAMVLKDIYLDSKKKENLPTERDKIKKAVQGLFKTLSSKEQEALSFTELYLPSEGQSSKLCKSTSLICMDILGIRHRIRDTSLDQMPLMLDLEEYFEIKGYVEILKKLPSDLQPKMLSGMIHEEVEEPGTSLPMEEIERRVPLKSRFQSNEFMEGLKRLAYHNKSKEAGENWEDVKLKIDESCQNIHALQVEGFDVVRTHLTHNGKVVEDSHEEVSFYFKPSDIEAEVSLYLNISTDIQWSSFAEEMNKHFYAMQCAAKYTTFLFDCKVETIRGILDKKQIEPLESTNVEYIPALGSYVPVELHPFLENDLREMFVGDYAALEIDDPVNRGEEGVAEYIFIKILERLENAENFSLSQRYRVKIGLLETDTIEVNCEEIYMFKRPVEAEEEGNGQLVVLSNHQRAPESGDAQAEQQNKESPDNEPVQLQTFSEIIRELRQTLTDTWELPEDRRRKVIKRLLFKWHPDKNPGRQDLCTKVFQWLQNAICALKEGRPIPEESTPGGDTGMKGAGEGDFWDRQFRYAGERASQDRQQWNNYRKTHRDQHYSRWGGGSSSWGFYEEQSQRKNPQRGTARRWLQQAQHDLRAATFDGPTHSEAYDWACYKAHQAVEKALTAVLYSMDANLVTLNQTLLSLVSKLQGVITCNIREQVIRISQLLTDNCSRMMYPTAHSTPWQSYTEAQAMEAARLADQIVDWAVIQLA